MLINNIKISIIIIFITFCIICIGCDKHPDTLSKKNSQVLRFGTSTTTIESGLMDVIIPIFEKRYGIKVDISIAGSGEILNLARQGRLDVVLLHSREDEDKFISQGYGINRKDVMYNDFVILGPPNDPLNLKGGHDALSAFKMICDKKTLFVSRGDNSGTHKREDIFWQLLGIKPSGNWYISANKDILGTLKIASDKKAYVLSDRSTYLFHKDELNLVIAIEDDNRLFNPYGVIAVNPIKISNVNYEGAMKFVDFITSIDGQEIICGYGRLKFNKSLFIPIAIKKSLCQ